MRFVDCLTSNHVVLEVGQVGTALNVGGTVGSTFGSMVGGTVHDMYRLRCRHIQSGWQLTNCLIGVHVDWHHLWHTGIVVVTYWHHY